MLIHNSHDPAYRMPIGAIPCSGKVKIRFYCDESDSITLRTWTGKEENFPMEKIKENTFEATVILPNTPQLFWYDFIIYLENGVLRYGNSQEQLGGEGAIYQTQPPSYQITVYDPEYKTPSYLRNGIIYQIFPDRFNGDDGGSLERLNDIKQAHPEAYFHQNWNERPLLDVDPENSDNRALDFFQGTLQGIIEKLDWLKQLGITVLYINPIFRARTNHRYDTGDYSQIDPILGTQSDFDELIIETKKRGIKVMLDGVFSHTGADSLYFNRFNRYEGLGAYQSKDSKYSTWYHFDEFPDKYRTWWGFYTLPAINKDNPSYRSFLTNHEDGILPSWVKKGAGGWRLDVADELPMDLLAEMRKSIKDVDEDSVLLGEVWEDASNKVAYNQQRSYCLGDTLDSVMNYPLRRAIIDFFTEVIDAEQLCRVIRHQQEVYPAPFYYSLMNLLGSHDRVRILNALAGHDCDGIIQMDKVEAGKIKLGKRTLSLVKKKYVRAVKLICALPGAPTFYYGDDIGMEGMADPWNRAPMDWKNADNQLHAVVRKIIHERNSNPVLQTGLLKIEAKDKNTIIIHRFLEDGCEAFGEKLDLDNITIIISRSN